IGEAEGAAAERDGWRAGDDVVVHELPAGAAPPAPGAPFPRPPPGPREGEGARGAGGAGGGGATHQGGAGGSDGPPRKNSWLGRLARAGRAIRDGDDARGDSRAKDATDAQESELPVFFGRSDAERER